MVVEKEEADDKEAGQEPQSSVVIRGITGRELDKIRVSHFHYFYNIIYILEYIEYYRV